MATECDLKKIEAAMISGEVHLGVLSKILEVGNPIRGAPSESLETLGLHLKARYLAWPCR